MAKSKILALTLSAAVLAPSISEAATFARPLGATASTSVVEQVQWRGAYWGGRPYYRSGFYGRPYWFSRPWVRRPYYGNIVGGIALGALVTVAVVGVVPRRPRPDLCWYWADRYRSEGYWDYC